MLLLTRNEITAQYGPSYPMGGARRFNAEGATLHRNNTHVYEFGYLKGYSFYAIVQKRVGAIALGERASLLASYTKAMGTWKIIDGLTNGAKDAGNKPDATFASNGLVMLEFAPAAGETNFPRPIFAAHQREGHQLVLWHPECQIDLAQIVANPLVY